MKIAGIIKNSFVDYPGQIAAVVFTQGCNYDCFFCHNRALIPFDGEPMDEDEIFAFLDKRSGLLDGVVITGGEPTLQKDLAEFMSKIREFGFKIKLDTNGSRPEVLIDLLDKNLIDYAAMDYKAPFERYDEICCTKCDTDAVRRSFSVMKQSGVPYELRTTFVPQLNSDDIVKMLGEVGPIDTFALQHYKMPEEYDKDHSFFVKQKPHGESEYEFAKEKAKKHAKRIIIR